jgi:Ca2+-binding RTX toxin-like protein
MRRVPPLAGLLALASACLLLLAVGASAQTSPGKPPSTVPLGSGALREAVELLERGLPARPGVDVDESGRIRVEAVHTLSAAAMRALIVAHGGIVEGEVPGVLTQARVPFDELVDLEREPGVDYLRPPLVTNVPNLVSKARTPDGRARSTVLIVGEEVAKTNADDWHAAGFTGAGVKVGIVDLFGSAYWDDAQAAGEVPAPAGTICRANGASCSIWSSGSSHGEGVAEIVHEMAPDAQLYLGAATTASDLQAVVDYFVAQGVDVITRSLTARYDGPGTGTGPIGTVVSNAVANGIVWFNSAGNSAGPWAGLNGQGVGSYWRGIWEDDDGDQWLEFAPGDELMAFNCHFINGVRWSDWGAANATDYDVFVYNDAAGTQLVSQGINAQPGTDPVEHVGCAGGVDYLKIKLWAANDGTEGDVLEFMINGAGIEYWQNPYSATGPAADTASPGGLGIGAVGDSPRGGGTTIAGYSSRGPSNDERTKPDMSAATCVSSFTFSPGCFNGTSAATPVVAGAAALVIDSGVATTPAAVKTYLLDNATVDRGTAGPDNTFGRGELLLPTPGMQCLGSPATVLGTAAGETVSGTAGDDVIVGLGGDDTIVAGGGNDKICGGDGSDTLDFSSAGAPLTANMVAGTATGQGSDSFTEVEHLTGSGSNDSFTGNAVANVLTGGGGNDVLAGGDGNDTLTGGDGNDTLRPGFQGDDDQAQGGNGSDTADYAAAGAVNANLTTGQAIGVGTDTLGGIENLTGSAGDDFLTGDGLGNFISGGGGGDEINGGDGNDTIRGGAGNDILGGGSGVDFVDFRLSAGGVTANLGAGTATGEGTDSATGFENALGSNAADSLTGTGGANVLIGYLGNDTLNGADGADNLRPGAGDDALDGGGGIDMVELTSAPGPVTLNLDTGSASGEGSDSLSNLERATGSSHNDSLTGNSANNLLLGLAGNDTLNGGAGTDILRGGAGNDGLDGGDGAADTADFAGAPGGVSADLLNGAATGDGSDTLSNLEDLIGSAHNDTLTGNDTGNFINAGGGNDTINAGGGNDTVRGGPGNDTVDGGTGTDYLDYRLAPAPVTATLATSPGSASGDGTDSLTAVENFLGSGFNDTLTGSDLANNLNGGAGNDTLSGLAGNDTLTGGAGDDTLDGGDGTDTCTQGAGAGTVTNCEP